MQPKQLIFKLGRFWPGPFARAAFPPRLQAQQPKPGPGNEVPALAHLACGTAGHQAPSDQILRLRARLRLHKTAVRRRPTKP